MTLYLDASALVKRYLVEPGSDAIRRATDLAERRFMSRVGFVETFGTLARRSHAARIEQFRSEWPLIHVIELREALAERAAELAGSSRLGALDAVHLASALMLPADDVVFATWDRRLHAAAQAHGLAMLPEALA